mmetsp:Transcript_17752/g.41290  ORF Transcript_17752/g.41290 Transcript_17752/m.41290 type:complete len:293 (+) Transcript_17752:1004-1882(+)
MLGQLPHPKHAQCLECESLVDEIPAAEQEAANQRGQLADGGKGDESEVKHVARVCEIVRPPAVRLALDNGLHNEEDRREIPDRFEVDVERVVKAPHGQRAGICDNHEVCKPREHRLAPFLHRLRRGLVGVRRPVIRRVLQILQILHLPDVRLFLLRKHLGVLCLEQLELPREVRLRVFPRVVHRGVREELRKLDDSWVILQPCDFDELRLEEFLAFVQRCLPPLDLGLRGRLVDRVERQAVNHPSDVAVVEREAAERKPPTRVPALEVDAVREGDPDDPERPTLPRGQLVEK